MITAELVVLKKKSSRGGSDEESGELVDLAARIRAVAEEYIGDSAHKTIEKHFLHALDGIMSGDGERAVDAMVMELEKGLDLTIKAEVRPVRGGCRVEIVARYSVGSGPLAGAVERASQGAARREVARACEQLAARFGRKSEVRG